MTWGTIVVKLIFCTFFGRIEDTKKTFRNQLTYITTFGIAELWKGNIFINNNVKKIPHFYDLVEIIYNWVNIKHPVWYVGITTLFEKVCSLISIAWNTWKFVQKKVTQLLLIFCWSFLFEFSNKTSFSLVAWLLFYERKTAFQIVYKSKATGTTGWKKCVRTPIFL